MFASLWHSFFLPLKHESSDRKYMCVWVLSWPVVSDSCDHIDCRLLGSSVHGILQARILEWIAISFSRGSARLRNWTQVFCTWRHTLYSLSYGGSQIHKSAQSCFNNTYLQKQVLSRIWLVVQFADVWFKGITDKKKKKSIWM